jgi:hypothetical protein
MSLRLVKVQNQNPRRAQSVGAQPISIQTQGDCDLFNLCQKPKLLLVYADWCGHCQTFKPEWNLLHKQMLPVELFEIEEKNYNEYVSNLFHVPDVAGFPSIFLINNGHEQYVGNRSKEDIVNWVHSRVITSGRKGRGTRDKRGTRDNRRFESSTFKTLLRALQNRG